MAVADADDAGEVLGRAVVDVEARAVRDLDERLEGDVEPVADRIRAGGDERVAAPGSRRSTPGSARATRWPASARSTGRSCTWTLRTRTSTPAGSARSSSPSPIDPDQRVPVTTVPIPLSVNTRSTYSRVGRSGGRCSTRSATSESAARRSSRPSPTAPLVSTTVASGTSSLRLLERQLARLLVHRVHLRERDDAVLDPQQPDDRQVLGRLGPRSFAHVDDEQEEVDPGGAGDHVTNEALVARDVDEESERPLPSSSGA